MSVPGSANPLLLRSAGGYSISRSLRFNSSDSAYLSRVNSTAGSLTTWTWSGWVKLSTFNNAFPCLFAGGTASDRFFVRYEISPGTWEIFCDDPRGLYTERFSTLAAFRDYSAWAHYTVVWDTNNATPANRCRFYVNGVLQALSGTFTQGIQSSVNNNTDQYIGKEAGYGRYLDGYLADIHFIDGQALDPTSFGEFDDNGIWQPIAYSGSYGTNGFHLDFADNSTTAALGTDTSGNGNTWSVNNISVTAGVGNDSLVDVPTNGSETDTGVGGEVRGNYCTLNPLDRRSTIALSNGNLDVTSSASYWSGVKGTIGVASGKYFFEATSNGPNAASVFFGICASDVVIDPSNYVQDDLTERAKGMLIFCDDGKYQLDDNSRTSYSTPLVSGDVIAVAVDLDGNTVQFYKNGTALGSIDISGSPLSSTVVVPFFVTYYTSTTYYFNFGQRPFAYTAPSGFKALCTANLPAPLVTKPSTVMDVKLYTGNGSTQTISGLGFSPDLVWIKSRSAAYNNRLYDQVRGVENVLNSNTTAAEGSDGGGVTAFTSTGFTLGSSVAQNENNTTYAAWTWDAGSSTVTNTQGSITSSVRTNNYLSVVTYTGTGANATVGHGLGVAPQMIITKCRGTTSDWGVYHVSVGATAYLRLNLTNASSTGAGPWNNTAPTSTVFSIGTNTATNTANTMVAYCFASVAGYSSFGSYTGNGSADGPFVYTGFRPRWILIKSSSLALDWCIFDAARDGYNADNDSLYPNSSQVENNFVLSNELDILSNGFKARANRDRINQSSATYVWAAFAENPFALNARAR